MNKKGKVWLVGAGPGDSGLLTVKGLEVLKEAEVVVYDSLVGTGILAQIPKEAKKINVGKRAGCHLVPQERINEILLEQAKDGYRVVRLKGGDPFLFGRGGEELELLIAAKIEYEIVPGITSAVAVPAYNGIPITHRDFTSSVHIITGHRKSEGGEPINYKALVELNGTLVFLMGVSAMAEICKGLMEAGMSGEMPAAILEKGTTAAQRNVVARLDTLVEEATKAKIKTPAIIVVGKVCKLADKFAWAEQRPLGNVKIAITRPKDRVSSLGKKLAELGAEVLSLPSIQTVPMQSDKETKEIIREIKDYNWIAFTSAIGVEEFFCKLMEARIDIRNLQGISIAAVGPATKKAVEKRGLLVDLMPAEFTGEGLGNGLVQEIKGNEGSTKLLIPRSKIGTDEILKPLQKAGISYVDLPIYTTELEDSKGNEEPIDLYDETVDFVAFTSASTVNGFVHYNPNVDMTKVKAICIGEQTGEEARKVGMDVRVSKMATIDSMIEEIIERSRECACS